MTSEEDNRAISSGRDMEQFDEVISFKELYKGVRKSQRNVMWKDSVAAYSLDALKQTRKIRKELQNGTYRISRYQVFTIHEPKTREIVATRIRDRQFQRSLCDNVLYPEITRGFIYDNGACLRGKGVDFTLNRMERHLREYYREHGNKGWVLNCDIHHYFPETQHDVAKAAVGKRIRDERCRKAAEDIIDSFGGDRGIGLGSQVSQLVELAVLDDMDHAIKEKLRIRHYIRYMDDFKLISHDREELERALEFIRNHLDGLGLKLNRKTQITSIGQGVKWLKWRFILTDTGKVIRKMNRKKLSKERTKLKKLFRKVELGDMPIEVLDTSFNGWKANAEKGGSHYRIREMELLYKVLKGVLIMGPKIDDLLRLSKAEARANAAAARCEKLAELLELKLAEAEGEVDALERIDAQEEAICELAEIIAEV